MNFALHERIPPEAKDFGLRRQVMMTKKRLTKERWGIVLILLLAWGVRWVALRSVPPGWRDDDLIELYTFSQAILEHGPKLYFPGASGHEPLFHTLRAGILAVSGLNLASARWMADTCGLLSVLLTWALARRLFTPAVGLLAAALSAVSFWSLMYSRVAIRHIGMLPWFLLSLYWTWRILQDPRPPRGGAWGVALGTGGALLTYYAGRLLPLLLPLVVLLVGTREGPVWRSSAQRAARLKAMAWGFGGGLLLAAPMFWTIAHISGGDARVGELAVPLTALRQGDVRPLWHTIWGTLGMASVHGDPEWLYNLSGRPVFGLWGALLFYAGILTRLAHLDQPNARLVLLWLGVGISPAFISLPPASYGHTIAALPVVYILTALPMKAAARRWRWTLLPLAALTLGVVAGRDLPDMFRAWPQASMVRFLYRADYRALANTLNAQSCAASEPCPPINLAVGSFLYGPWDKVAVQTDLRRPNVSLRWVNPERALVDIGGPTRLYLQDENQRQPTLAAWLAASPVISAPQGMQGYEITLPAPPPDAVTRDEAGRWLKDQLFDQSLRLRAVAWEPVNEGRDLWLATWWEVVAPLPLPPEKLIPNPPPPGVYSGPRLKVYTHLLAADGTMITGDDGLWVDPYSLQPGDRFVQWHHFSLADGSPKPTTLSLGLYDPKDGKRWLLPDGRDEVRLVVP